MRVILVKPTNATRRLDSTGEVLTDGDRERLTSGAAPPPTKLSEGEPRQRSGAAASFPPEETSFCCGFPPLRVKSNGVYPVGVSDGGTPPPPPKSRNLSLSELSDQDWLLLHSQVSGGEPASPPQPGGACFCSCPGSRHHPEASSSPSKRGSVPGRFSNLAKSRSHSSSPYIQVFPQSNRVSSSHQALVQEPAAKARRADLLQTHLSKGKESGSATLLNIPLDFMEPAHQPAEEPQAAAAAFNWTELFGTEPILVQQRPKQDSHEPTSKASPDPSVLLSCHQLSRKAQSSAQREPSPPASGRSGRSQSSSQYGSFQTQELLEEVKRHCQVRKGSADLSRCVFPSLVANTCLN